MRGDCFMLLFFIIYSGIITILLILNYLYSRKKINNLDKYNEELNFELAKLRRKWYLILKEDKIWRKF